MVSSEPAQSTGDTFLEADHLMQHDMCKHEYRQVVIKDPAPGVVYMVCRFCLHSVRILLVQPEEVKRHGTSTDS